METATLHANHSIRVNTPEGDDRNLATVFAAATSVATHADGEYTDANTERELAAAAADAAVCPKESSRHCGALPPDYPGVQFAGAGWLDAPISMQSNITLTRKLGQTTVREEVSRIRLADRQAVENVRTAFTSEFARSGERKAAKKAASEIKKRDCSYVTFSGSFCSRANNDLLAHNGIVSFDLDHIADVAAVKARLAACPNVGAVFLSVTAHGLRVLVPVTPVPTDAAEHKAAYDAALPIIEAAAVLKVDDHAGQDVARASFITSDPEAHLNPVAVPVPWEMPAQILAAAALSRARREEATAPRTPSSVDEDDGGELVRRHAYVQGNFTVVEWESDTKAKIECPGIDLHTGVNAFSDCTVWLDGVPSVRCFHQSCLEKTEAAERKMRAALLPKRYTSNDAGRAEQFVDNHARDIRYVPAWDRWLIWCGHYWRPDADGAITRLAVSHSHQLIRAAAEISDHGVRAAAVKDALRMGDAQRIGRMLEIARCDARVVARHDQLDADPFLLGVQNGVVELRTGIFREGRREDLITKRAGTDYVEAAQCPRWLNFLGEVLAGDPLLISYVQCLVGYTLTGDVSAQCFPFLYGSGKNGKSVFTEVLQRVLGDYGQRAPASLLTASSNGREPTHEIARLHGARLVIGSETEEGSRLAESRVKDLTGGDTLTGRFLYAEPFDFRPCLKLWLFGNHKPAIRGTDDGIWRRVRLIPFIVQIPEDRRDPQLPKKLAEELPGILQWALQGTQDWLRDGLSAPNVVTEASAEYREEEDTLGDFITEKIVRVRDARTAFADMFAGYREWAERNGLRLQLPSRMLSKRLKERGFNLIKAHGGNFWEGVQLR